MSPQEWFSPSASIMSALFNLIPAIIVKIDVSELPKLVEDLWTHRDDLPNLKAPNRIKIIASHIYEDIKPLGSNKRVGYTISKFLNQE